MVIRETEIESILKSYLSPIFKVANLNPENIKVYLVIDNTMNAFATLDYSVFVTSGLITKAGNADQLIGVLAHETGHIAGGHVARKIGEMGKASQRALASALIGALVGAASKNPEAGLGVFLGGTAAAQNLFLHYSRAEESTADQAALKYMKALGWSPEGLLQFMEKISHQELLIVERQDKYLRTHPLTRDRIKSVKNYIEVNKKYFAPLPESFQKSFSRLKAKVEAFILRPGSVIKKYAGETEVDRYARSIAFARQGDYRNAMPLMSSLVKENPKDPFFWDQEGDMYYDQGKFKEAITSYQEAVALKPVPFFRLSFAAALLALENKKLDQEAIEQLEKVVMEDRALPWAWRFLAIAYGRQGKMSKMAISLAEQALVEGDYFNAIAQSDRTLQMLKKEKTPSSATKIRAQDIITHAEELRDKKR